MSLPGSSSNDSNRPTSPSKTPFFFREEYSGLIVKGNFMTLAAKPALVEEGEWLAHQVVEQYRLLEGMLKIIQEIDYNSSNPEVKESKGPLPICNSKTCPAMVAAGHTYTWLDNNKNPIKIPAHQYIGLVQKWIMGKFNDPRIFPTDSEDPNSVYIAKTISAQNSVTSPTTTIPGGGAAIESSISGGGAPTEQVWLGKSSGFPRSFEQDIRSIYRQMMRCYAHIYHGHWVEPFWHVGAYKELNTCFVHFVNVGKLYGLLGPKDMEPMGDLIRIWDEKGLFPAPPSAQPAAAAPGPAIQSAPVAAA